MGLRGGPGGLLSKLLIIINLLSSFPAARPLGVGGVINLSLLIQI